MKNSVRAEGHLRTCGTVLIGLACCMNNPSASAEDPPRTNATAEFRIWRSADLSVSQEAKLDSIKNGYAHVILRDESRGKISVSALSHEDQKYLSQLKTQPKLFEPEAQLFEPVVGFGQTSSEPRVANKPVIEVETASRPSRLPPEYRILGEELGVSLHLSPDDFTDKDMATVRAELDESLARFKKIKSQDAEVDSLATTAATIYAEMAACLDRIEQLPKPPSDLEFIGSSILAGFATGDPIMGAIAGASVGAESDAKKQAIIAELEQLARIHQKGDVAHLGLSRVAKKYAGPTADGAARIAVDIDESWGSYGPYVWCCLYNHGATIKDSTIEVELIGANSNVRKNVHFVEDWPSRQWLYARYEPGQALGDKQVGSQTVVAIKTVNVRVFAPELSTAVKYEYAGAEKDKDVGKRLEKASLAGRYQPFSQGFLWDTQRGCYATLKGIGLPLCRVDVNFMKGGQKIKGWVWTFDYWRDGEEKAFLTNAGDLTIDPDEIIMEVSFPDTSKTMRHRFRAF